MIQVVGLGPGSPGLITMRAFEAIKEAHEVVLRTKQHEVAEFLKQQGIAYSTYDSLYEVEGNFENVYAAIVDDVIHKGQHNTIVYAVPGHPLVAERTVELLLALAIEKGVLVEIIPGLSSVEAVYAELKVDPAKGVAVLDALDPSPVIDSRLGLLITQVFSRLVAGDLKLRLLEVYPAEHIVSVVRHAGTRQCSVYTSALAELDHRDFSYADTLYVPPCPNAKHASRELERLQEIMVRLRSVSGCPWDCEQTHATLKPYLIEEAYEVLEAIDDSDKDKLAEELGDLLLQVVFHATIAEENGDFVLADSIQYINDKMVRRHPHVFGDVNVENAEQVLLNWQKIKQGEREGKKEEGLMDSVPTNLPALQQAYKVQDRAKRVGFDWPSIDGAWDKVHEELAELDEAWRSGLQGSVQDELGDVLFSVVNLSRFLNVEPENALRAAISKFRRRFSLVEARAQERGIALHACSLEELDKLWDEIKREES